MRDLKSSSYMEMAFHTDGQDALILRIPTFWDPIELQWIGFIKTPKTKKLISAIGQDSFELQNNFNIKISEILKDPEMSKEVFSMFKSKKEWEDL